MWYRNQEFFSSLGGDFSGNGAVEQADLDLVLLNWGRDGLPLPDGWIGPPPAGIVDQEELDAVLLNWGSTAASPATSATPAYTAPLFGAFKRTLGGPGSAELKRAATASRSAQNADKPSVRDAFFAGLDDSGQPEGYLPLKLLDDVRTNGAGR